jgi:AraC-like DNA-binding protein
MPFEALNLKEELTVRKIVTIHYFEYMNTYDFPGEAHDFWELVCVDKGEVHITADASPYILKRGQIFFHAPNQFHTLKANGTTAPNLVVISFHCDSPCMKFFQDRVMDINETERTLLARIISEARKCISPPFDNPYTEKMERLENPVFGAEQLIKLYMEQMLLLMIRRGEEHALLSTHPVKSITQHNESLLYHRVAAYLEDHIREHLTIEQICKTNLIGRSQLQKLFREQNQCGVIYYFSCRKIELAKQLIRENHLNFTQISDYLGYTSVHYFSRQFKKIAGMTPSEYASSIKGLAERK